MLVVSSKAFPKQIELSRAGRGGGCLAERSSRTLAAFSQQLEALPPCGAVIPRFAEPRTCIALGLRAGIFPHP